MKLLQKCCTFKKKKKNKEKEMKNLTKYIELAKDNPKITAGVVIGLIVLIWVI